MSDLFPIVSLRAFETASRADRALMAAEVDRICCETGFLAVTDHGVPQPIIDGAWAAARAFFDQTADVKQQARAPYPGYPYGYLGPNSEALAASRGVATPPDLKESFNGGPLSRPPGLTDKDADWIESTLEGMKGTDAMVNELNSGASSLLSNYTKIQDQYVNNCTGQNAGKCN